MAPEPESVTGSGRTNSSISELVSELRDSFLSSDFDRVEEALVAREARLKAELKEKEREIASLKDRIAFEMLERINVELELKKEKEEKKKNGGFGLGNGESVKNGKCEGVGEVGGGKVGFLGERGGVEVKRENENENEKKVVANGINGFVKRNGNGFGDSAGGKLERRDVIDIVDSDEDECNSQATLDRKETPSCAIIDNDHQSSSAAFVKPLLEAETIGNLKRKFAPLLELGTNINGLDSETSSSSSSSCSSSDLFDMNNLPISDKKTRADAASSGLNFSQR